jgi:hypothetical protein
MGRVKLALESITVESFATARAGRGPGTVRGFESDDGDPPLNTAGDLPTCNPCDSEGNFNTCDPCQASNQATCDTCQGPNCTNVCPA